MVSQWSVVHYLLAKAEVDLAAQDCGGPDDRERFVHPKQARCQELLWFLWQLLLRNEHRASGSH